jgi:hypothetical protein
MTDQTTSIAQLQAENHELREALDASRLQLLAAQDAHAASLTEWNERRARMNGELRELRNALGMVELREKIAQAGPSTRDYFAAAALTGLVTNPRGDHTTNLAAVAYRYAGAMLAERERILAGEKDAD